MTIAVWILVAVLIWIALLLQELVRAYHKNHLDDGINQHLTQIEAHLRTIAYWGMVMGRKEERQMMGALKRESLLQRVSEQLSDSDFDIENDLDRFLQEQDAKYTSDKDS